MLVQALTNELENRKDSKKLIKTDVNFSFLNGLSKPQRKFLTSTSTLIAACCTRRAGKSYACASAMLETALTKPGSNILYIGLTRTTAKRVVLPIIKDLLKNSPLNSPEENLSELTLTFNNGSQIVLTGADSNEGEIHKLLGVPLDLVVIDEAQSFAPHIKGVRLNHSVFGFQ